MTVVVSPRTSRSHRAAAVTALLLTLAAAPAAAQTIQGPPPPRPKLVEAGADTNDAMTYYAQGVTRIRSAPKEAAAAFYWANQIDPTIPEALAAYRQAMMIADKPRLVRYWRDDEKVLRAPEVQHLDSLYFRALAMNPLLFRPLQQEVLLAVYDEHFRRAYAASRNDVEWWFQETEQDRPTVDRAWFAYGKGRFRQAAELYQHALREAKPRDRAGLRMWLAQSFYQMGQRDSALAEFDLALKDLRSSDAKRTVVLYDSKAMLEHSRGLILAELGRDSLAREAYGRALQEDLSYYPAHAHLAMLALRLGDTTTALAELELAVQINGDDAVLRYATAHALAVAGRAQEALVHLQKAVAMRPAYAGPYLLLGHLHESAEMHEQALEYYGQYLARASRTDPMLATAQASIVRVRTAMGTAAAAAKP